MTRARSAAVVGSGPNGLAAAVTLARAGVPVTVFEASDAIGGGMRTEELLTAGVLHDHCASIHPLALASGFFRAFGITKRVDFRVPEISFAHPLESGEAALAYRDLARTIEGLGRDGGAYQRLLEPLVLSADAVIDFTLGGSMLRVPEAPRGALQFLRRVLQQGVAASGGGFREEAAPALLAGAFAHSGAPLPSISASAAGLLLTTLAHTTGWPVPIGGSRAITEALVADLLAHGGRIETGHTVTDARELSDFDVRIYNTSARALARIEREALPRRYMHSLRRLRPGNGICVVHWELDGPIPWRDTRVAEAPTVHVGGTRAEIAAAEREVARGHHAPQPYVLVTQTARSDPERNAAGVHAISAYSHVPHGSTVDVSEAITTQIERFAPGFRDHIRAARVTTAAELGEGNLNLIGGDIAGGAVTLRQLIARPTLSTQPWSTPVRGRYLASASTAPGPGVHGLAGWYAARAALRKDFGLPDPYLGIAGTHTRPTPQGNR